MPFLHKKAMSRFRCSGHMLKIETGRHHNIDRENRFCQFCETTEHLKVVEDELSIKILTWIDCVNIVLIIKILTLLDCVNIVFGIKILT